MIVLVVAVPFAWVVLASFRQSDVLTGGVSDLGFGNHVTVLSGSLPRDLLNSLVACGVAAALSVGVAAPAAYAFSRFRFPGRDLLFWLLLVVQVVPAVSLVVPLYKLWSQLDLFNTIIGLAIAYAGLNTAVCLLLLKGFLDDLPRELDEAAAIDGCSPFVTFRRVVLPLLAPALTSAGILAVVATWQEYGGIMAGSVLTALPVIMVFAIFQRQFVQTVTGGLKG